MTYATQQSNVPPAGPAPINRRGSGMATAALVLGIIALLSCWTVIGGIVLGVVAVVLGIIASRRASRGETDGQGRAIAGIVTGALGVVLAIALIAFGLSILNSPKGKQLQNCVRQANGNQTAVQQCDNQYRNSN